jgi:TonB-linked SusC/RagA family outer membrane protein
MKFYTTQRTMRRRKLLLAMKLTTLLLLIGLLQVSAKSFSQITVKETNASLAAVLKTVEKQSGYYFVYNDQQIKLGNITVDLKNATIDQTLKAFFADKPITYQVIDKNIVLLPKGASEPNFFDRAKSFFAQVTVTGKVTDETGQPLISVTVKIKNTNTATATDAKGVFSLTVPDDKAIIAFSYIGYETVEFAAKDISTGSVIQLKAIQTNLKEIVVSKGYYSVKQELNTGNVTKITSDIIGKQPVNDPIQALEGRVSGLQISQTSGLTGSINTILLRGKNSIANGNVPLFVVDGVPYIGTSISSGLGGGPIGNAGMSPFSIFDSSNIESIEVLKDADATAIYGSRGANGVIIITTKKGAAGRTRIDANFNTGWGNVGHMLPLLNTEQYLQMRREAFRNDKIPVPSIITAPTNTDNDINGRWDTTRYTNWQQALIGGTARYTNAQLSLSGGNTNTQFLVGGTYSFISTVFPGSFNDQKANANVHINHHSDNQKFQAGLSVVYSNDNNQLPGTDLTQSILLAPDAPLLYNNDGSANFESGAFQFNPIVSLFRRSTSISETLNAGLTLSYEITSGLQLKTNLGYTNLRVNQTTIIPAAAVYNGSSNSRSNQYGSNSINNLFVEPQLSYGRKLGKGQLDVLIGSTFQDNKQNYLSILASGFSADVLIPNRQLATTVSISGNNTSEYKYNSLYGRVGYNWEEKYIVNLTARRDGSSRFGSGKQFGNFGSVGAAWIFSKESWLTDLSWLSFGKLRASYGTVGNDQITDYQYLSSYIASANGGNYQNTVGLIPNRIGNPYFAWESTNKFEAAFELGFLNDRIQLNANWYQSRSSNQLVGQALPIVAGFRTIQANLPATVENSGLEFDLHTTNIKSTNFSWNASFNISFPRNKLISFPNLESSSYRFTYKIGQPLYMQSGFLSTGVDPNTGVYAINDSGNAMPISSPSQRFFGGLGNTFTYKNLSLDVFLQFVKQTGTGYFNYTFPAGSYSNTPNQPIYVLNRWQKPGDLTNTGLFSTILAADPNFSLPQTNLAIVDASFIRLKNVALSYKLPAIWVQKAHINGDSDECDQPVPFQAHHPFRGKLTRVFRG